MKIAVCIKQVPTREWQPRLNEATDLDSRAGRQLRAERAGRLRARRGAAAQGEARRRGRRLLGRPGARRAGHPRGAGPRRRPRHPRRGRRARRAPTRSSSAGALAAAMRGRAVRSDADRPAVRRSGLRADRRRPRRAARPAARDHHHGSAGRRTARLRVKRELEGGWFQWVGDAAAGGADDPERHQPAALRDAQGHHGGEEEGDPQGRRRSAAVRRAARSVSLYVPEKTKKTQMIAGSPAEAATGARSTRLRDDARVI